MSTQQNVITSHWNDRAASYQFNMSRDFMSPQTYERWKGIATEVIGSKTDINVLDAGCGTGVMSHILAKLGIHRITAADVSEAMIRQAESNLKQWSDRIEFICRDISDLPIENERFDLVISRYVLWTVPDPCKTLGEWLRILKPGGRLAVIDGNWYRAYYRSFWARLWMKAIQKYYQIRNNSPAGQKLATAYVRDLHHTHLLRPDWDIGLLTGLGFEDVRVRTNLTRTINGWSPKRFMSPFSRQFLIQARKPAPEA